MRLPKVFTAFAGAIALSLALSGVVAADATVGQTGHFIFTDTSSKPGAKCYYTSIGNNMYRLARISVRPPAVWWPDTTSNSNNEHGPVGQQVMIQHRQPTSSTWAFLKQSGIQHAQAHEDHPLYDPNDRASLARLALKINGTYAADEQFRANVRADWFSNSDGALMGYAVHVTQYYEQVVEGFTLGTQPTGCPDLKG